MKEYPTPDQEDQILDYLSKVGRRIKKMPIKLHKEVVELDTQKEIRYTYEGLAAERSFCRKIQQMNKEWTRDEINQMSFRGENKSFGHKGQNYSIWKYKGGPYCKHWWNEWVIMEDEGGREYRVDNGRAKGEAGQKAKSSNNYWKHPSNVK